MNRLLKYKNFFHNGAWHCHTKYTDGKDSVFDMCKAAEEQGLPLIAFTEHVRKELDYNFFDFVGDIERAKKEFSITILLGVEAKILNLDGELDVGDDVISCCDLVMGVFHGFPYYKKEEYLTALYNMIISEKVDLWGHPFVMTNRKGFDFTLSDFKKIIGLCLKYEVLYERNLKYSVPDEYFNNLADKMGLPSITGMDAHDVKEVYNFWKFIRR